MTPLDLHTVDKDDKTETRIWNNILKMFRSIPFVIVLGCNLVSSAGFIIIYYFLPQVGLCAYR